MPAALTIDLKGSRKFDNQNRELIQYYLIEISDALNEIFQPSLLKNLRFNGGDELQGLFKGINEAYLCLRFFRRMLFPLEIYAGIGEGEWTTVVKERDTFYQDGSAYHNAREAIECAKREADYTALLSSKNINDIRWNAMMNAGFRFINRNTVFQNDLAILLECIFPIHRDGMMDFTRLLSLLDIIKIRNSISTLPKKAERNLQLLEDYNNDSNIWKEIDTKGQANNNWTSLIYKYSHPYSAASIIAKLTGISRQSIDVALKASNVYVERAVAMALIDMNAC